MVSWDYLVYHGELAKYLAKVYEYIARGYNDKASEMKEVTLGFARVNEDVLNKVFDVCLFCNTIGRTIDMMTGKEKRPEHL